MKLPTSAHTGRPWRIHAIAPDFRVQDVWALPTPGGPDDFGRLVSLVSSNRPSGGSRGAAGLLWTIRERLGGLLGWDDEDAGLGTRTPSLRDRLPADLRDRTGPELAGLPFSPVYRTDDEWVAEIANRTVHGAMHLGWVPDGSGGHRGQMAVLVKPNGLLGSAYLAAIGPARHLVVYPAMMRRIERDWRAAGT